jgi:hypothetical protein
MKKGNGQKRTCHVNVKLRQGKKCQTKKYYVEDDDEYGGEIKVTGSRKSVEVYQEDFDDKLTDDVGHKSLEKEGNCTVIQKADAKLMVKFGNSATVRMGKS